MRLPWYVSTAGQGCCKVKISSSGLTPDFCWNQIGPRAFHFWPSSPTPPQIFDDGVAGADAVRTGNTIVIFFWVGGGKCRAVSARVESPEIGPHPLDKMQMM